MSFFIRAVLVLGVVLIFVGPLRVNAQRVVPPDPDKPRPIDALDTVFIEEMTWLEVRDAIRGGKTTVIVATGGVEQNGPWVVTGKHNYILGAVTEVIARKLGNALVAPIIKLVPEGDHDPPSRSMRYPGTVSLREETFRNVLIDVCSSFKPHGFRNIVLIGDSGGNLVVRRFRDLRHEVRDGGRRFYNLTKFPVRAALDIDESKAVGLGVEEIEIENFLDAVDAAPNIVESLGYPAQMPLWSGNTRLRHPYRPGGPVRQLWDPTRIIDMVREAIAMVLDANF